MTEQMLKQLIEMITKQNEETERLQEFLGIKPPQEKHDFGKDYLDFLYEVKHLTEWEFKTTLEETRKKIDKLDVLIDNMFKSAVHKIKKHEELKKGDK